MENIRLGTIHELSDFVSALTGSYLFRGQNKNYSNRQGFPSLVTSFSRLGCVPDLMLQWTHYARFVLSPFVEEEEKLSSLEFLQSVLQHYGWRSFYLDASSDPAVSSWFAGHTYKSQRTIEMTEDCHESFLWRVHQAATYVPAQDDCHFYVIDRDAVQAAGIGCHDLSAINLPGDSARFQRQKAWLIGHMSTALPKQVLKAHVTAPAEVFRGYARARGISEVSDLFPNTERDPLLQALMSLPWKRRNFADDKGDFDVPVFERTLEIPDYDYEPQRRLRDSVALFDSFSIEPHLRDTDGPFKDAPVYKVPSPLFFGRTDYEERSLELLSSEVEKHGAVVIETEDLVRFPDMELGCVYGKGIFVCKDENGFMVADLVVDHPGTLYTGFGINAGWHYSEVSGSWRRISNPRECPCKNHNRHKHHMSVLYRFEEWLIQRAKV